MQKVIVLLVVLTLLSCRINGLTDDYGKLSSSERELIKPLKSFDEVISRNIYPINGNLLMEEIKKHPKALVYSFVNGCKSEFCKPLMVYENFANQHGYKLFLVMEGYSNLDETFAQPFTSPLFSLDRNSYQTVYRSSYSRRFQNQLEGKSVDAKSGDYLGSLYFFSNGKLDRIVHDLPNNISSSKQ